MSTTQPTVIDEIKTGEIQNGFSPDILELEWFENKKQKLTRTTVSGLVLELRLSDRKEWQQGDLLYSNDQLIAAIHIKRCLTICFKTDDEAEAADFCYFIGNQHLPLFFTQKEEFAVPYDGRLYEQLFSRYDGRIELISTKLLSSRSLRSLIKNNPNEN